MRRATSKSSSEVREGAVRMVFDPEATISRRVATVVSIADKIGGVSPTLHEWDRGAQVSADAAFPIVADERHGVVAGLGFSIVRDFAIQWGGDFSLGEARGGGTAANLWLPIA